MNGQPPFFSIIVPTHNRPQQLGACLRSLARQGYPPDRFEVIVVDDGSATTPAPLVDSLRTQLDVTLLTQGRAGPATARNTGAERAHGKFLAFTDDDCLAAADWLQTLARAFVAMPDSMIGGQTRNALDANPFSTASQLLITYLYSYYNADHQHARFLTSNNLAAPAATFRALGGFDTSFRGAFAEDREFCDRWLYAGYRMAYMPDAVIYHAHTLTLPGFWRQHVWYGRGAYTFRVVRAKRDQRPIRLEPRSFYFNLLRYPFATEMGWRALALAALLGTSQVANALGYFWERARQQVARRQQRDP